MAKYQTQQWTVVPVSHRITLTCRISNIQLACGLVVGRGTTHNHNKNAASPINRDAAAVFPQQKITGSVLADPCVLPHLSSSSDLRILSSTQPSQD